MTDLTDEDRAILDFERGTWRHRSLKEQAAREQFGLSAVRYAQRINALIDRPEALAYSPTVVRRLQRRRQHRAA